MHNKHDTSVKQYKLSKHALITLLLNTRSSKDDVCSGTEMRHVKVIV